MQRLVLLIAAALAALAASATASAADTVSRGAQPGKAQSPAAVRAYWTQDRVASARPAEMPRLLDFGTPTLRLPQATGRPQVINRVTRPKTAFAPAAFGTAFSMSNPSYLSSYSQGFATYPNGYPANVGQLRYTNTFGESRVCTGTVVDTNLVLTAAHCVYDVGRGYGTNFSFAPRYNGTDPYGTWAGGRPIAFDHYKTTGFDALDYAFVKFQPSFGRNLSTTVGTSGILINPALTPSLYEMGYPVTGLFRGNTKLYTCHSPWGDTQDWGNGWYSIGIGCQANGGTSGGPWFQQYGTSWNYIASVTSKCWNGVIFCNDKVGGYAANLWGPYFNSWTRDLYNLARAM